MDYRGEDSIRLTEFTNSTRDLVLCVMFTGCRREEGQTLKWSEVDIEKGTFIFKDPKTVMIIYCQWVINCGVY